MHKITPQQNRRLHQLLTKLGLMADKASMIREYSCINSTSSRDLLQPEANALIRHLEALIPEQVDPADQMRKKMLMYGYEMDYDSPRNDGQRLLSRQDRCFQNVNAWCKKYSPWKKGLNEHTAKELPALLSQFEKVYKSTLKKL